MALINLNLISKLEAQADVGRSFAESCCYNHSSADKVSPEVFMTCIKRAVQAETLFDHLASLYKETRDFAAGNFQAYLDEHERYREDEDEDFNPFDELYYHFNSGMITDLPEVIEQYTELLELQQGFSAYRKKLDEGFNELLGGSFIPQYLVTDENGDEVALPRTELPEDVLNEIDANQEIEGISVEYCLDHYNEFYQECRALIESHRITGNIKECAESIQLLFTPYHIE